MSWRKTLLLSAASPLFPFLASWIAWLPDLKPYLGLSIASRKSPTSFLEAQNDIAISFPPDGFVSHLISSKYGHVTIVLHGSKLKKTAQFPLLPPCPLLLCITSRSCVVSEVRVLPMTEGVISPNNEGRTFVCLLRNRIPSASATSKN